MTFNLLLEIPLWYGSSYSQLSAKRTRSCRYLADILACFQENSLFKTLGHLELDLPDPPEKAARPPPQPVDPYSRYGPKAEITHIFRSPEKRPPKELSLAFSGLVLLPLLGFLGGVSHGFRLLPSC